MSTGYPAHCYRSSGIKGKSDPKDNRVPDLEPALNFFTPNPKSIKDKSQTDQDDRIAKNNGFPQILVSLKFPPVYEILSEVDSEPAEKTGHSVIW